MTETLCTSGAVKHRVGAFASSTVTASGAWLTELINQAEGQIAAETMVDWVSVYSTLSDNYKKVLEQAAACWAANAVIGYDPSGFLNVSEAAFIVNLNWGAYDRALKVLSEAPVSKAIGGTLLK